MPEHTELLPDSLPAEPLAIVKEWLAQATAGRTQPNPNSMVLATASPDGHPSARVVLCKDVVVSPGFVVFYTNYHSAKGRELADNPYAEGVMHWDALHRQVRIAGPVTLAPSADSDAYFAGRPWQSRLAAWASQQSAPIGSRALLLEAVRSMAQRFGAPPPESASAADSLKVTIPRPPHWGGYRLWAQSVELWVEGAARVHDRARWTRRVTAAADGGFSTGAWSATRLQP